MSAPLTVHNAEDSAAYIFGDAFGDPVADRLLRAIRDAGAAALTRNECRNLFSRHISADRLDGALNTLKTRGLITEKEEQTAGRPRTVYRAVSV
jgi:hypothetical protein